jgi:hypothetical protein
MTLRKKLLERGFVVCEADPSLFVGQEWSCVAAIYVDDGIVAARDAEQGDWSISSRPALRFAAWGSRR